MGVRCSAAQLLQMQFHQERYDDRSMDQMVSLRWQNDVVRLNGWAFRKCASTQFLNALYGFSRSLRS